MIEIKLFILSKLILITDGFAIIIPSVNQHLVTAEQGLPIIIGFLH